MRATVTCPSCNRSFSFKPELAGKRAKCRCGGRIEIPSFAEAPAFADQSTTYLEPQPSFASDSLPLCAACGSQMSSGDVLCTACGYNQRTGQRINTQIVHAPVAPPQARRKFSGPSFSIGGSTGGVVTMIVGAVICIVGIGITVGTYNLATERGGGTYIIAYGPVIFGGITFLKGLVQMLTGG